MFRINSASARHTFCHVNTNEAPDARLAAARASPVRSHARARPASGALVALALVAGLAAPACAVDRSWIGGHGVWNNAAHWTPLGVPNGADIVRIGNMPGMNNLTVFANANVNAAALIITNGMGYQNEGHTSTIGASTYIGAGSRMYLTDAVAGTDFSTPQLVLEGQSARVYLDEAMLRTNTRTTISPGAYMHFSFGHWRSNGAGDTLVNDGRLLFGPGSAFMTQEGNGRFDLDGTSGGGELLVSGTSLASVAISGVGLRDAFNGVLSMGPYARLHMLLSEGWATGPGSTIEVFSGPPNTSEIAIIGQGTGTFTLGGHLRVYRAGADSQLTIAQPTIISPTATGLLSQGTFVRFTAPTTVTGGEFTTYHSGLIEDGGLFFDAATNWRGTTTFNGLAMQSASATVSAASGAVINASTFIMDGVDAQTTWNINSSLVVNAGRIAHEAFDAFDGQMIISGGFAARLAINLAHGDAWTMRGAMNLTGTAPFPTTRLAGSPVVFAGDVALASGRALVTADATFSGSASPGIATTTIGAASAELRFGGVARVEAGALFAGDGRLGVAAGGALTLEDGVNLGGAGVLNDGTLAIATGTGAASVHRYEQSNTGALVVSLGGYLQGDDHDLLIVAGGPALIDGRLSVELASIAADTALFAPQIGDAFTILTALGGVSGAFSIVTPTIAGGMVHHWSVEYEPNAIVVRLDDIVPVPPCMPDFNGDGTLDFADVQLFLNLFSAGNVAADVNGDGIFDFADVQMFLNAFSAGCP
ncbi:MAG: hypothetical protein KF757_07930 [Phycisphaeraceae bacterium]|nr:hypothetical protein [Phycisphaeraceae bacterium]MCW5762683.1 hypothetical protein [Phycisphaeraceae bacterium]